MSRRRLKRSKTINETRPEPGTKTVRTRTIRLANTHFNGFARPGSLQKLIPSSDFAGMTNFTPLDHVLHAALKNPWQDIRSLLKARPQNLRTLRRLTERDQDWNSPTSTTRIRY